MFLAHGFVIANKIRAYIVREVMGMLVFFVERIFSVFVISVLFAGGIFFIFRLKFFALRHPVLTLRPFFRREVGLSRGETSPRRALWLALGGVLGVGNIVGVSCAIYLGGAGAVFWMCASACVSAALKYAETVLALSVKRSDSSGGKTCDYIRTAISAIANPKTATRVSALFALLCIAYSLSMGCVIQINAISGVLNSCVGLAPIAVGVICAVVIAVVAAGGLRRISRAVCALVPIMSVLFAALSLLIIILRRERLPEIFSEIIRSAFDFTAPDGVLGGVCGFFVSRAVRLGVSRGLLSNEGGAGTSPMAHSVSSPEHPAEQGFLGIVEVLIDTVVLCTLTATVILISFPEVEHWGANSVMMTVGAYTAVLGEWAEPLMCALVCLFGLATVLTQIYYGGTALTELTKKPSAHRILILAYMAGAMLGSIAPPQSVWLVADLSIGCMTIINVFVLFLERRRIALVTEDYFSR